MCDVGDTGTLGAGEMSDWIESETPSPSVDTGLGGSCVSNPHPFVSSSSWTSLLPEGIILPLRWQKREAASTRDPVG